MPKTAPQPPAPTIDPMLETLYLAASLMMVDIPGPTLDPATRAHLAEYKFGGVCLFRKNIQNPEQVRKLTAEIREVLGEHVLIAVDQEGGAVQRVLELPLAPSAMAIGAINDPKIAGEIGAAVGRNLISLGINWNFAPSLDVNTDPRNPVIGDRSFGSDPKKVARLGVAWAKGLEGAGVMASVKHFPGHGDTALDSHLDLPVVDKNMEELQRTEFYPFQQAVKAKLGSVMTSHIRFPILDKKFPATLSKNILTGLLRERMGFEGIVVTDALDMQAITRNYSVGEAAAISVKAGADMILSLGKPEVHAAQAKAIAASIDAGKISRKQALASQKRLLEAAERFPSKPRPYRAAQLRSDYSLMNRAALASITAFNNPVRPKASDKILIVSAGSSFSAGPYGETVAVEGFATFLKTKFAKVSQFVYDPKNPTEFSGKLEKAAAKADFLLVISVGRDPLDAEEAKLLRHAFKLGKPATHIALWNPYHILTLRQPAFVTYGFRVPTLEALVKVLAGAGAKGMLPFKLR